MVDNRKCPVCGKTLKYSCETYARSHNKYCSLECYEYSRSALLQEAKKQNKTPREVLVNLLNEYGSAKAAAEMIGTTHQILLKWRRKYGIRHVWV